MRAKVNPIPLAEVRSFCAVSGGRRMRMTTSLTCGWCGSCTGRRALVIATGILEAVFTAITFRRRPNWYGRSDHVVKCCRGYCPREHQREGPACGRHPDWMQHYPAHVTCSRRTSSSRDQPPAGCLVVRSDDLREFDCSFTARSLSVF